MLFQVAALCDAATDHAGKLNLLGAFDTIVGGRFPLTHPQCALALRMIFTKVEEGDHKLQVALIDEDGGQVVKPIVIPLTVALPPQGYFASRNIVINLQRLPFAKPGQYAVDIALDGRTQVNLPLQVLAMRKKESEAAG
ncbi:MAG: hypothetical protein BWZ02_01438 [Lentisphaerae bacterium ADurb.BinA184]|nr:MAG: hypothetical protein BWZ02_01438 [Lentisphaerae bacterium ADurb.BinA184]